MYQKMEYDFELNGLAFIILKNSYNHGEEATLNFFNDEMTKLRYMESKK